MNPAKLIQSERLAYEAHDRPDSARYKRQDDCGTYCAGLKGTGFVLKFAAAYPGRQSPTEYLLYRRGFKPVSPAGRNNEVLRQLAINIPPTRRVPMLRRGSSSGNAPALRDAGASLAVTIAVGGLLLRAILADKLKRLFFTISSGRLI